MLAINQASIVVWAISYLVIASLYAIYGDPGLLATSLLSVLGLVFVVGALKPIRQKLLSNNIFKIVKRTLPKMSATEREAIDAGNVGFEANIFSGSPNLTNLLAKPRVELTLREQAFLHGPVEELCRMINDWEVTRFSTDLPDEIWEFMKRERFFGMIIPKSYGGLEFSATAQMQVLAKLYGRSITLASTVAVPNSLGPAELLLKYGTKEQKDYYLPRLADGREIPCFALTGPNAGSDAASIPDTGVVCYEKIDGEEVLGIKLNWDKRYITLCPVATVIGLAFQLFDPNNFLGRGKYIGISCALVPADTKGVIKGRRHFPLDNPFQNGPTQGKDVFLPINALIGGAKMAGLGWRMLMECLSVGRAISLPSSALGGAHVLSLASGAYARVRKQFNMPIGYFEGIEEPLSRIAAKTYMIDAALSMTTSAIDSGIHSAVAGAILKYHTTEWARECVIDAMDIHGGKGICLGPKNYLGRGYQGAPISITVEGANILTRNLIIYGQGAIRCHPYVFDEIESVRTENLQLFDNAFWGHVGHVIGNFAKSIVLAISDGRLSFHSSKTNARSVQLIHRYSTHLAFLSDFAMITLGGKLKRMEKTSARIGDMLSYLYIASAVLKKYKDDGSEASDLPLCKWSLEYLLSKTESQLRGVIDNFPGPLNRFILRVVCQPFGKKRKVPSDKLGQEVAKLLLKPSATRDRLTRLAFKEPLQNCPVGTLEETFKAICDVADIEKKLAQAQKEGKLKSLTLTQKINEALGIGILTKKEAEALKKAEAMRQEVIAVDDFSTEELMNFTKRGSETAKKPDREETIS